ncbi:hypothetical protein VSH64_24560 [Amycolatopsis rhabdoformis]|uniref:Uncharacterized protein n=1 Tax=Amycolatopsis rhabdoformis TaxID=1448059 RepID=A0ABZ1HUI6_9PSEU|nr:hypothetical protein [Amycolatopsis rhabdoformis]WSE26054.1 hypothetical protein VSH64_24560 [Amycolatopsis rhabdoformis]
MPDRLRDNNSGKTSVGTEHPAGAVKSEVDTEGLLRLLESGAPDGLPIVAPGAP